MTIKLTLTQRINLHGIVASLRLPVGQVRQAWALMDKVRLTRKEESDIDLHRSMNGAQEMVEWDVRKDTTDPREFDLSDSDVAIAKEAFRNATLPISDASREWLAPLLDAFGT